MLERDEWAGPAGQERTYAYAVNEAQDAAYRERAEDKERKAGHAEWAENALGDVSEEP